MIISIRNGVRYIDVFGIIKYKHSSQSITLKVGEQVLTKVSQSAIQSERWLGLCLTNVLSVFGCYTIGIPGSPIEKEI